MNKEELVCLVVMVVIACIVTAGAATVSMGAFDNSGVCNDKIANSNGYHLVFNSETYHVSEDIYNKAHINGIYHIKGKALTITYLAPIVDENGVVDE